MAAKLPNPPPAAQPHRRQRGRKTSPPPPRSGAVPPKARESFGLGLRFPPTKCAEVTLCGSNGSAEPDRRGRGMHEGPRRGHRSSCRDPPRPPRREPSACGPRVVTPGNVPTWGKGGGRGLHGLPIFPSPIPGCIKTWSGGRINLLPLRSRHCPVMSSGSRGGSLQVLRGEAKWVQRGSPPFGITPGFVWNWPTKGRGFWTAPPPPATPPQGEALQPTFRWKPLQEQKLKSRASSRGC